MVVEYNLKKIIKLKANDPEASDEELRVDLSGAVNAVLSSGHNYFIDVKYKDNEELYPLSRFVGKEGKSKSDDEWAEVLAQFKSADGFEIVLNFRAESFYQNFLQAVKAKSGQIESAEEKPGSSVENEEPTKVTSTQKDADTLGK